MPKKSKSSTRAATPKAVETLTHDEAKRKNIPTAEYSAMHPRVKEELNARYKRNRDLDPQLMWRGKDEQDWSDLVVNAPALWIQEKVHPKALVDDLLRQTREQRHESGELMADLFADFNGIAQGVDKTEFYQHDQHWSNRMILGDSLQVMASLAEREGLRGRIQCIYFDPPYGIKFNSNFQWSTTSRDVKDGNAAHITREPEMVKAFRDTWRDGIHSYLTYLRDRLTVARDLLTDSGCIFVQIGDENVHRVRSVMDEVFGDANFITEVAFKKTAGQSSQVMSGTLDYLLLFAKDSSHVKLRPLYRKKEVGGAGTGKYQYKANQDGSYRRLNIEELNSLTDDETSQLFAIDTLVSQRPKQEADLQQFDFEGQTFTPGKGTFKSNLRGLTALRKANRLTASGKALMYRRFLEDFPAFLVSNLWEDTSSGASVTDPKVYVVQTGTKVVERCLLMATDPGDLVLDPTCGSGTTATAAEQWGRRWITIDTSRVALALARARIMGARYPFYLLADSRDGQHKEAEVSRTAPSSQPVHGNIRHGFVYERVPHIMLSSIANNAEIDVIWEKWQRTLEPLREKLNDVLRKSWQEWEIPREPESGWSSTTAQLHADWWHGRISRQKEIDASIAAKADFEYLYDKPYEDKKKVRVAG
ncbi:MAG: site-specific DNA-methyltransferase, partial [Candidatus Acidiferrales bacterium]